MANEGITASRIVGLTSLDEAYELAGIEGSLQDQDDLQAKVIEFLGSPLRLQLEIKKYPRDCPIINTEASGYHKYSVSAAPGHGNICTKRLWIKDGRFGQPRQQVQPEEVDRYRGLRHVREILVLHGSSPGARL